MQYPHGRLFNSYQDYPIMNNIDEQIDIDVPSNTYESDLEILPFFIYNIYSIN
jgi:hypothetical protein